MSLIGKRLPEFNLDAYDPKTNEFVKISDKDLEGEWKVLMFYPADFTFVCPTELEDLQEKYGQLKEMGMLYALGVRFFDKNLNSLNPVAKNMIKVDSIDTSGLDKRILDINIEIATSLPLTLFQKNSFLDRAMRKGASNEEILKLEKASKHFSKKISEHLGVSEIDFPYLGVGGGVSWALYIFFKAKISNSMELVLSLVDFEKQVKDKDLLIITENVDEFNGENSINLAKFAKRYNKDIKIIFLQDEDYQKLEDNSYIDNIYEFSLDPILERSDYEKEIRSMAKDFIGEKLALKEK